MTESVNWTDRHQWRYINVSNECACMPLCSVFDWVGLAK